MKTPLNQLILTFLILATSVSANITPSDPEWPSNYPNWWYSAEDPANGVIDATQSILNEDNDAVLTIGQLKNVSLKARDELDLTLAPIGGAGVEIDTIVDSFNNNEPSNNYSPANIGQLKNVSSKFLDRFEEIEFTPNSSGWPSNLILNEGTNDNSPLYPWLNDIEPENDKLANIGQIKHLFSWDVRSYVNFNDRTNWYVDQGSGDDSNNDGLSDLSAFSTIQHAVNQASNGDVINISEGIYSESIVIPSTLSYLTLQRVEKYAPGVVTIDAGGTGAFVNAAISASNMNGLTIRNIRVTNSYAGIRADGVINLSIEGVIAENNRDGIVFQGSSRNCYVNRSTISNNNNVGVVVYESDYVAIRNCEIDQNNEFGIYVYGSDDLVIRGNKISANNKSGIFIEGGALNGRISRNSLINNNPSEDPSYTFGAISLHDTSNVNYIKVNNFRGNYGDDIANNTSLQLDARYNWWKSGTPEVSGNVLLGNSLASEFIGIGKAIWTWEGDLFWDATYRTEVINYCINEDTKVVYINVGPYYHNQELHNPLEPDDTHYTGVSQALAQLRQAKPDLIIEALIGDYAWLIPEVRADGVAFIQKILDYQKNYVNNEDALFDRIHVDVEADVLRLSNLPQGLQSKLLAWEWSPGNFGPEWEEGICHEGERRAILHSFLDMMKAFRETVDTHTPGLHRPEFGGDIGGNYDNALSNEEIELMINDGVSCSNAGNVGPPARYYAHINELEHSINELPLDNEVSYVELDLDEDGIYETPGWWAMMDTFDYVTLMIYSDNSAGLAHIIENEAAYLESKNIYFNNGYSFDRNKGNGSIIFAKVLPQTTFYDDPWHQFLSVVKNLRSFVEKNTSWTGEAYHFYDTYQEYLDGLAAYENDPQGTFGIMHSDGSISVPASFGPSFTFIDNLAPQINITAEPSGSNLTNPIDVEVNVTPHGNYESLFLQISGSGYPAEAGFLGKDFEVSADLISPGQNISFQFPVESGEDYTLRVFGGYVDGTEIKYTYNTSFIRRNINIVSPYALNVELKAPYDTIVGDGDEANWAYDNTATIKLLLKDILYDGSYRIRLEDGNSTKLYTIDSSYLSTEFLSIINLNAGQYNVYLEKNTGSWTVVTVGGISQDLVVNIQSSDVQQNRFFEEVLSGDELPPVANNYLITDAEEDFTNQALPDEGSEREWTRFGDHLPVVGFDGRTSNNASANGAKSVMVSIGWAAEDTDTGSQSWGGAVRYHVQHFDSDPLQSDSDPLLDASSNPNIHYKIKYNGEGDGNATVKFVVVEDSGEEWEAKLADIVTTNYQTFSLSLDTTDFNLVMETGSIIDNQVLDSDKIKFVGFNLFRGSNTTGSPKFNIDDITWGPTP